MKNNSNKIKVAAVFTPLAFYLIAYLATTMQASKSSGSENYSGLGIIAIMFFVPLQYLFALALAGIILLFTRLLKKNTSFLTCLSISAIVTLIFPAWYIISSLLAG